MIANHIFNMDFCFNPCFSGSSTATFFTKANNSFLFCFNPCFSGSSTATCLFLYVVHSFYHCFNPCFSGSSTATSRPLSKLLRLLQFQSLFFWKFHCNKTQNGWIGNREDVSILVFLEVPLQRDNGVQFRYRRNSFNPCFSGSSTATEF